MQIKDLERLAREVKILIAARKKQDANSGKDTLQMTEKARGNHSASLTWLAMDMEKAVHEAHAAAVDCGIADPRAADRYGKIDFYPSSLHHYTHQPTKPRCRQ
jgi:hypothetical protein